MVEEEVKEEEEEVVEEVEETGDRNWALGQIS